MKVLSLLPSATEIVFAVGAQDSLCGVSCDCDYPQAVASKPVVSAKVLPITAATSPGEIDRLVRDQLQVNDSIYSLDRELIQKLRPDLILAQDLCRVCAVPSGDVAEALDYIGCSAQVLSLDPHSLDDVLEGILAVGRALGVGGRAEAVVSELQARLERVRNAVAEASPRRVVSLEWQDPPFNGGHWVPEMTELAGGTDLLGAPGARSRTLTWHEIEAVAPDVIVYMPCGYDLAGAVEQSSALLEVEEFVRTPAALNGDVFVTDSSAYFSRSGPRLIDGVEILTGILHPNLFPAPDATKALRLRDGTIEPLSP